MAVMTTWKSDVYHVLLMCHVYIGCQNKVLGIMSFVLFFRLVHKIAKNDCKLRYVCCPPVRPST